MSVVLVTGGIGSGKSAVCRILRDEYGYPCYDADSKIKELYVSHPSLLMDIENELGVGLRDADGTFVAGLLAERIFASEADLNAVESLVFPVLAEDFDSWKSGQDSDVVILESATALEKDSLADMYDKVVVVDAPFDVRLSRACSRDGSDRASVLGRMRSQKLMNLISDGYADSRVDYLLKNASDMGSLRTMVADLVATVLCNR